MVVINVWWLGQIIEDDVINLVPQEVVHKQHMLCSWSKDMDGCSGDHCSPIFHLSSFLTAAS